MLHEYRQISAASPSGKQPWRRREEQSATLEPFEFVLRSLLDYICSLASWQVFHNIFSPASRTWDRKMPPRNIVNKLVLQFSSGASRPEHSTVSCASVGLAILSSAIAPVRGCSVVFQSLTLQCHFNKNINRGVFVCGRIKFSMVDSSSTI
jgi:hypothetical protein